MFDGAVRLVIMMKVCHYRAHQSSPCIKLIILGFGLMVLMDVSDMTCRNTPAGRGVLRVAIFTNSLVSAFFVSLDVQYGETFEIALHSSNEG
jgi:hypothetical protein